MNQIEDYKLIADLLKDAYLPRMARVRQNFPRPQVKDVEDRVRELIARDDISALVKPGMEIAVTCGSRGIANIRFIIREVCRCLPACRRKPGSRAGHGKPRRRDGRGPAGHH